MLKSRKRMLLSSIAMLLVALVALGSATFAWYATQNSVTAKSEAFKAAAAQGLVIKDFDDETTWTNEVTLKSATSLTPAAFNFPGTYANLVGATGIGQAFDDGTLKSGTNLSEQPVANNDYFLVDKFAVASSSGSSVNAKLQLSCTSTAGSYMILAVYVGGTLRGVYTSDDDTDKTGKITSAHEATPVTFTDKTAQSGYQELTEMNDNVVVSSISVPSKDSAADGLEVDIVAFTDGFNEDCRNSTVSPANVQVTYTWTTV